MHWRTANRSTLVASCSSSTYWVMAASLRPKIKTATLTVRLDPKVKLAAEAAAEHERRSLTSLLEVLILDHCRKLGLPVEQLKK